MSGGGRSARKQRGQGRGTVSAITIRPMLCFGDAVIGDVGDSATRAATLNTVTDNSVAEV